MAYARFRLKSFFVVVGLMGVLCALAGQRFTKTARLSRASDAIAKNGGTVIWGRTGQIAEQHTTASVEADRVELPAFGIVGDWAASKPTLVERFYSHEPIQIEFDNVEISSDSFADYESDCALAICCYGCNFRTGGVPMLPKNTAWVLFSECELRKEVLAELSKLEKLWWCEFHFFDRQEIDGLTMLGGSKSLETILLNGVVFSDLDFERMCSIPTIDRLSFLDCTFKVGVDWRSHLAGSHLRRLDSIGCGIPDTLQLGELVHWQNVE